MKKIILIIAVLIILPVAWYLISPIWRVEVRDEASPLVPPVEDALGGTEPEPEAARQSARLIAGGPFKPRAHDVAGRALLIEAPSGRMLRFEDFETINGPNLHIYLASSFDNEDYVDLGAIRATKGSVNYEVPASVDTAKYSKVLVWCVPFGILFSYAELQ